MSRSGRKTAEQFRAMAFAQLAFRESLRDIEACLGAAQQALPSGISFAGPLVRRSTLAKANESRDWRIHAEVARRLIAQARRLYAQESLGVELGSALSYSVRENAHFTGSSAEELRNSTASQPQPIDSVRILAGQQ